MDILKERLKEIRNYKNITQRELANIIGIAQSSVGNYENGERIPDGDVLVKYSKYFEVSTDYLLGISDVKKLNTTLEDLVTENKRLQKLIGKVVGILSS